MITAYFCSMVELKQTYFNNIVSFEAKKVHVYVRALFFSHDEENSTNPTWVYRCSVPAKITCFQDYDHELILSFLYYLEIGRKKLPLKSDEGKDI